MNDLKKASQLGISPTQIQNPPQDFRWAMGLTLLLILIVSAIAWVFESTERASVMQSRKYLVKSIAFETSSYLEMQNQHTNNVRTAYAKSNASPIYRTFKRIVSSNDNVLSLGLRHRETLEVSSGAHPIDVNHSQIKFVEPIVDDAGDSRVVECCFRPIYADRPLGAWIAPHYAAAGLFAIAALIAVPIYFRLFSRRFELSNVIPLQIEQAFNSVGEGILLTDSAGAIKYANQEFADSVGVPSKRLTKKNLSHFDFKVTDKDSDQAAPKLLPWDEVCQSGQAVDDSVIKLIRGENEKSLVAKSFPVFDSNGRCGGALTRLQAASNMTQDRELGKTAAIKSNPFTQKFLSRSGHETRTAMNAILGYVDILSEETDDPSLQKYLQSITSQGEHLISTSHDMFELANLKLGKTSFEVEPTCIFSLIDDVVSSLREHADSKQLYLKSQSSGKLPVTVNVDAKRLRQAISHLLASAIEFTSVGGVLLETSVYQSGRGSSSLQFAVTETGDNMPPGMLATLFEPFSGPDFENTDQQIGTEFGLAICKELAIKMGGDVSVKTNDGPGRTFYMTVDIGDVSGVETSEQFVVQRNEVEQPKDGQVVELPPMHVLIVDDGESNRQVVSAFLRKANATFEHAINGQEAVEMVNAGNFSAVLMDMRMPVMNGFEATRILRSGGHQLPIIALTANASEEDQKACLRAGCSQFLAKPIARERLLKELSLAVAGQVVYCDKPEAVVDRSAAETVTAERATTPTVNADTGNDDQQLIGSSLPMDDEDFIEVAEIFVAGLHKKNSQMIAALESANFAELVELGHWLKGAAGSAGYGPLSPLGRQLEEAAKEEDMASCVESATQIIELSSTVRVIASQTAHTNAGTAKQHSFSK